jgi:hypothetical protein
VSFPRYRTLDGDEVELPLAMDRWVLVPRTLARFDPELAWTLDYEDAPEPEDADPRLDFSGGALLVPVERWNEHAALEPNLAPCPLAASVATARDIPLPSPVSTVAPNSRDEDERPTVGGSVARIVARAATTALAALALGYVVAVGAWLWSLRHQISGPDVSTGLLLVGAAMLLAWLAGVAGAVPGVRSLTSPRSHDGNGRGASVCHRLTDHPLAILRLGLALQFAGFLALVAIR